MDEEKVLYTYDSDEETYFFAGDLEAYLQNYGVSAEHINRMKARILETNRDFYQDFPELNSDERGYMTLVPLDKVIGTSRGTPGVSVFENVRMMHRGDREPCRFQNCLGYLDKMSLDELQKSYGAVTNSGMPRMVYYVDDDKYYVEGDGNHRTLTAMLVGAKQIWAKVTNAHCNEYKKKKYQCSRALQQMYGITQIMRAAGNYDISFQDEQGIYEICGFPGPKPGEDFFLYLEEMSYMIDADREKAETMVKYPALIQKIMLHLNRDRLQRLRIPQYMNKHYLTEKEQSYWREKLPVELYEL